MLFESDLLGSSILTETQSQMQCPQPTLFQNCRKLLLQKMSSDIEEDKDYEMDKNGELVLVKSVDSRQTALVRFNNRTSRPVEVWWTDYNGARRYYMRIPSRHATDVNTYVTHPWSFSDAATGERFVVHNKRMFRAPPAVGNMNFRTTWNITVPVRTLKYCCLLTMAVVLRREEQVTPLGLPGPLADELRHLVATVHAEPRQRVRHR